MIWWLRVKKGDIVRMERKRNGEERKNKNKRKYFVKCGVDENWRGKLIILKNGDKKE